MSRQPGSPDNNSRFNASLNNRSLGSPQAKLSGSPNKSLNSSFKQRNKSPSIYDNEDQLDQDFSKSGSKVKNANFFSRNSNNKNDLTNGENMDDTMAMANKITDEEDQTMNKQNYPPFESDIMCCFCVPLLTGVKIMLVFGMFDIFYLVGNVFWAAYYNILLKNVKSLKEYSAHPNANEHFKKVSQHLSDFFPDFALQEKETVKFFYVVAAASVIFFFYVLWILSTMSENRQMRTPMERMQIVSCMSHYLRKTFLFYLIVGVTYAVLLLGEEKTNGTDYHMLVNIFGNAIVGIIVQSWWVMTYKKATLQADKDSMNPETQMEGMNKMDGMGGMGAMGSMNGMSAMSGMNQKNGMSQNLPGMQNNNTSNFGRGRALQNTPPDAVLLGGARGLGNTSPGARGGRSNYVR